MNQSNRFSFQQAAIGVVLLLLLLAGAVRVTQAQSGGDFDLSWSSIDGGSDTTVSGGDFTLGGTIGQPDAHQASGGIFELRGGFWNETSALTLITLESFEAIRQGNDVVLQWTTAAEVDSAGFNVYRSDHPDFDGGAAVQLNAGLIASQAVWGQGASYAYVDEAVPAGAWYYFLEDIDVYGESALNGPVFVDTSAPTSAELSTFEGENSGVTLSLDLE